MQECHITDDVEHASGGYVRHASGITGGGSPVGGTDGGRSATFSSRNSWVDEQRIRKKTRNIVLARLHARGLCLLGFHARGL